MQFSDNLIFLLSVTITAVTVATAIVSSTAVAVALAATDSTTDLYMDAIKQFG